MQSRFPAETKAKRTALLAAVEAIRETVIRHALEGEAQATLPRATVDALVGSGLLTLKLPMVLDGAEADPATQFDVIERLSAIDPAAGWCLMIGGSGIGMPGAFLDDTAIARIFAGGRIPTAAIVAMPTGEAVPVDGGYRVSGRWSFMSGVRHSEWITVGARVPSKDGTLGKPRLFVLPTKSAEIHDNWHDVAGLRGTGSCDVSLKDCIVPEAFSWDRLNTPAKRGGALYRLGHPGFVANEHAAFALGVGRGALDALISIAKSKRRSFTPQPTALDQRPVVQRAIGLGDLRLRAARELVLKIYAEAWEFACAGKIPPPRVQAEIRSATAFATDVAAEVTTEAFRLAGGAAVYGPQILQRYLRDINVAAQHLMVSTISYETHGQFALGFPDVDPLR